MDEKMRAWFEDDKVHIGIVANLPNDNWKEGNVPIIKPFIVIDTGVFADDHCWHAFCDGVMELVVKHVYFEEQPSCKGNGPKGEKP